MINSKFALDDKTFVECNKFKAFDCLSFISNLIKHLPEKTNNEENIPLTREFAESFIMLLMDTGKKVRAVELKDSYAALLNSDYFVTIFQYVFINGDRALQESLTEQLLSLCIYNNAAINQTTADFIFTSPAKLYSLLTHVVRYNYNDFFLITD